MAGIDEAIIATDPAGRVMFLNAIAETLTGWPLARAYGRPLVEVLPLADEHMEIERVEGSRDRNRVIGSAGFVPELDERGQGEWVRDKVLMAGDGRLIPVEYRTASISGDSTRAEGSVLLVRDITGRKRVQKVMAQLAAIVENSDDAIIGVALDGTITNWNDAARRLYGYVEAEIVGQPFTRLVPPHLQNELARIWETIGRGEPIQLDDTLRLRRDGTLVEVWISLSPIRDGGGQIVGFSAIARDITERKRHEEEKHARELLRRLADVQEEERRRIARDLHDRMGQHLAALKLGLERMRLGVHDPERLEHLLELTKQIGQDSRRIALELRPATLDDLGLKTALMNYVAEWSERSGIEVDYQDVGLDHERLPATIETAVYRVMQESLTNVLKHAGASRVSVILECREDGLRVIVEDDGKGFNYETMMKLPGSERGLGLPGMRERISAVGGELQVETSPDQGTSLFVRIPLNAALAVPRIY